jgi:uncharacterized protein YndB with AHSA1/START domain
VPRFDETRAVAAADDVVWQLLTEPDHVPRWLTVATEVRADGPLRDGQQLVARGRALGVGVELDLVVVRFEPTRRYAWRVEEPVTVEVAFALDAPSTGRCVLTTEVAADIGDRPSVRARLAVRVLRGELSRSLDGLVTLAETA